MTNLCHPSPRQAGTAPGSDLPSLLPGCTLLSGCSWALCNPSHPRQRFSAQVLSNRRGTGLGLSSPWPELGERMKGKREGERWGAQPHTMSWRAERDACCSRSGGTDGWRRPALPSDTALGRTAGKLGGETQSVVLYIPVPCEAITMESGRFAFHCKRTRLIK